ncbi:MAG: hypothetical protein ACYC35_13225 [Pirellulales bacterium]
MRKLVPAAAIAIVVLVGLSIAVGKGMLRSVKEDAVALSGSVAPSSPLAPARASDLQGSGQGMAAMRHAAGTSKYLFAFFWKEENDATGAMRRVFEASAKTLTDQAESVAVRATDPAEKDILAKFDLARAPMPLVLAIAPNGAVTGGFPTKLEPQELAEAIASPVMQKCLKALQENKLVFLCVQNDSTEANAAALAGVRDFQADVRYRSATEIVMLDPADAAEAKFLGQLQISPKTTKAVTAFLAPPGAAIGEFEGATTKADLIATLEKANTGCGPGGCGPGGCAPKP